MGYSPSPRPNFQAPTHVPYEEVTRHLWGDESAGRVADWIYVSSEEIHQLLFGLPPGGSFGHSDSFRTIFAADELLYVLSGTMVLTNPQTGEVHRVLPGEAAFFRRDTWHHAFNHSTEPLRVLEYFAPPPSQGTSGSYAQRQPNLTTPRYTKDEWMARWPLEKSAIEHEFTIRILREEDVLWRLEGKENKTLVGIVLCTEHLTVGRMQLLPGQRTDVETHRGDESLYVLEGTLNLLTPEKSEGQSWFELAPSDGFYLPKGTPHHYYNMSGAPVEIIFGVAPEYLPAQEAEGS